MRKIGPVCIVSDILINQVLWTSHLAQLFFCWVTRDKCCAELHDWILNPSPWKILVMLLHDFARRRRSVAANSLTEARSCSVLGRCSAIDLTLALRISTKWYWVISLARCAHTALSVHWRATRLTLFTLCCGCSSLNLASAIDILFLDIAHSGSFVFHIPVEHFVKFLIIFLRGHDAMSRWKDDGWLFKTFKIVSLHSTFANNLWSVGAETVAGQVLEVWLLIEEWDTFLKLAHHWVYLSVILTDNLSDCRLNWFCSWRQSISGLLQSFCKSCGVCRLHHYVTVRVFVYREHCRTG